MPVLDIQNTGTTIPMACRIIAITSDLMNPYFFPSDDQIMHDGAAANPTTTQTNAALPLKPGIFSAMATINVPVTI